ncbi:Bifunctional nuclease 1, variant 3 [Ancistrocladus abbreviatus]
MATVQVPFTPRISCWKRAGLSRALLANELCVKPMLFGGGVLSLKRSSGCYDGTSIGLRTLWNQSDTGKFGRIRCCSGSPNDHDKIVQNFDRNDDDDDYINSTVLEAVEVKNGSDAFLIKMRDGRYLRCVYNHSRGGYQPDYISHPAIVLKMEDGSGLLLPIIVLEMPSALLMAALRNVQMARPTVYQIVKEMIETMGYKVKLVRVTNRVQEAYFAELCIVKVDNETQRLRFGLRPSDAINIAVRCKAPIQVNKYLAYRDGLKIVEPINFPPRAPPFDGILSSELDRCKFFRDNRPDGQPCPESEEFVLLRNMLIAAVEERYRDAAQWKDLLNQFRSRKQKWT